MAFVGYHPINSIKGLCKNPLYRFRILEKLDDNGGTVRGVLDAPITSKRYTLF